MPVTLAIVVTCCAAIVVIAVLLTVGVLRMRRAEMLRSDGVAVLLVVVYVAAAAVAYTQVLMIFVAFNPLLVSADVCLLVALSILGVLLQRAAFRKPPSDTERRPDR